MKFFIVSGALFFSVIGCSCHGGVNHNRSVTDNVISREYVVVIDNTEQDPSAAQKEIQSAIEDCEVKMISKNIAHIITDPKKDDPGLEKIKTELSKFKWVKSVEQNKEVHIN